MSAPHPVPDSGLQNERTSLAWRRTALALLVAAATMAKVTAPEWGAAAAAWLLVGAPGALAILVGSSRIYQARRTDSLAAPPATAVVLASATTTAIGALALVLLLG